MSWSYKTAIGTFFIRPAENKHFTLYLEDILLGYYDHPETAARDVINQSTGWPEWDNANVTTNAPFDLSEWIRHPD